MASSADAVKLKDEGNQHLKEHRLAEAVASYTAAIDLDATNPVFFLNRAQAQIKLENYGLAVFDCDQAIALDDKFAKAWYRKAVAQMAILQYKEAQANLKKVLELVPNDRLTLTHLKQCQAMIKRQAFEKAIAGDGKISVLNLIDYEGIQIEKLWQGRSLDITATKDPETKQVVVDIKGLDREYLKDMIKLFKDGQRLPKQHVFAIVAKVNQLLREENTLVELHQRHPKLNDLVPEDAIDLGLAKLTVVGDTHGQFYDVLNMFAEYGPVDPENHAYLFNGDFVDRGSWSCEVALYLYVLKILYPKLVFINRGNHETNDMNINYGFADECEHKYSKKVYEAFAELFGALPLATLVNQLYLVMHGGLFSDDKVTLQDIKKLNRLKDGNTQPPKEGIAMELLWTDPQPVNGRGPLKRGIGMQFGPDITERFCLQNKIRKVLRSHEVRNDGYETEHKGRLITVFLAPNYCDATGNKGAVIDIDADDNYNPDEDDGEGYRNPDVNSPWKLTPHQFDAVPHPDIRPMAYTKSMGF